MTISSGFLQWGNYLKINPYYSRSAGFETPVRSSVDNMWTNYFAQNQGAQKTTVTNPFDAMGQLNQLVDCPGCCEETDGAQKAQKLNKSQKKLLALSKKLEQSSATQLTDKMSKALNIIAKSPLSNMEGKIEEKLANATSQEIYLIQKVTLGKMQDLEPEEIEQLINDVNSKYKELKNDWQKIKQGIIKIGAYAEAMIRVEDTQKQEEYRQKAEAALSGMPDPFKDKEDAEAVSDELGNMYGQEVDENGFAVHDDCCEDDVWLTDDEAQEIMSANPFTYDDTEVSGDEQVDDTSSADEITTDEQISDSDDNEEDISTADSDDSETSSDDTENDSELGELRQDVEKELKKQRLKHRHDPFYLFNSPFSSTGIDRLDSILGLSDV